VLLIGQALVCYFSYLIDATHTLNHKSALLRFLYNARNNSFFTGAKNKVSTRYRSPYGGTEYGINNALNLRIAQASYGLLDATDKINRKPLYNDD